VKKRTLLERAKADPRSAGKKGPICSVCKHKRQKEIDADLVELRLLQEKSTPITMKWFAETHLLEEYGLKIRRQTLLEHEAKHKGREA
jgi:hypothetical protein